MELDQFRDVDLVIDYANYTFIEKQFVSQGDYKGRTLTVQVTNNGVVGEVPGLMLNLNWHNEASGLTDLSAFSILDKANSIYRIEYPQHMMTPGKVLASIQVIQNGKVTNLKEFELTVQKLAGQPVGIVEKAEFSALVAVLADANKFRTDIDRKADKTFVDAKLAQITLYATDFGAKCDGVTDDSIALQSAFDELFKRGGGSLLITGKGCITTKPILVKSVAAEGGYDYPKIKIIGEKSRETAIKKQGTEKLLDLDATLIAINGNTMDLNSSLSAISFENIRIINNSAGAITYGFYMKSGSRIISDYSSFSTLKSYSDIDSHDRYACYLGSSWACTFRDSTFHGDYGLYQNSESTSLLLENTYASADKIGYRLVGTYSTLINAFGDYGKGILFDFYFATVVATFIAGEAPEAHTMMRFRNSNVKINKAFFNKNDTNDNATFIDVSGSNVEIDHLIVWSNGQPLGYLWKASLKSKIIVRSLTFEGTGGKFAHNQILEQSTNGTQVEIYEKYPSKFNITGTERIGNYISGYLDWYMANPKYKVNSIVLGMKEPSANGAGDSVSWDTTNVNDVFINTDFSNRKVLGWVRHSQTSQSLLHGSNSYVPLILEGPSSNRPQWKTIGMSFFDSTLGKPIWWNGLSWVDATGTVV